MESPNYVLRSNQIISVPKSKYIDRVQGVFIAASILIVIGTVFFGHLFGLIPWVIRLLIIIITVVLFLIPNKKLISSPFEIRFHDEYFIIYHKIYHSPPKMMVYEKIFYSDVKRCQYRNISKKIEIFCVVERTYYLYDGNEILSNPTNQEPVDSVCFFNTNVEPEIDFLEEIQKHSPLKVVAVE